MSIQCYWSLDIQTTPQEEQNGKLILAANTGRTEVSVSVRGTINLCR